MKQSTPSSNHLVGSLILFAISAVVATLLLISAAVVWLSVWTGSYIVSALILGGAFALAAVSIYLISIRAAFRRIRGQFDMLFEVAHTVQALYRWANRQMLFLVRVALMLFRK